MTTQEYLNALKSLGLTPASKATAAALGVSVRQIIFWCVRHDRSKQMSERSLNSLEVYADCGRKAARAVQEGDWSRFNFHRQWILRAVALETPQWARMARAAFDSAYRAERESVR